MRKPWQTTLIFRLLFLSLFVAGLVMDSWVRWILLALAIVVLAAEIWIRRRRPISREQFR
jgi:hypothetical protein